MMVSSEGQERKERSGGGDNGGRNKLAKGAREEERLGEEIRKTKGEGEDKRWNWEVKRKEGEGRQGNKCEEETRIQGNR